MVTVMLSILSDISPLALPTLPPSLWKQSGFAKRPWRREGLSISEACRLLLSTFPPALAATRYLCQRSRLFSKRLGCLFLIFFFLGPATPPDPIGTTLRAVLFLLAIRLGKKFLHNLQVLWVRILGTEYTLWKI